MFNRAWLAGGIPRTACVAAYEPICAVSLADSYINRANPGTYTAAPGVAPTWAESTGWTFNGTTQYLTSSYIPSGTQSILIRVSNISGNCSLVGCETSGNYLYIYRHVGVGTQCANCDDGSSSFVLPEIVSGVVAISGRSAYRNGAFETAMPAAGAITSAMLIGCRGNAAGSPIQYTSGNIQAIYIYNVSITPTQVRAVTDAMNMLPQRPTLPRQMEMSMRYWQANAPALGSAKLNADRLYNRSGGRIWRRGDTG